MYEELVESLEFFKSELRDFELCRKWDTPFMQNDEGYYLNRLIRHHKVAIKLLEDAVEKEIKIEV